MKLTISLALCVGLVSFTEGYNIQHADSLNCRTGPNTNSQVVHSYKPTDDVSLVCQTSGETVQGNTIWDKTVDGCYVSDYYIHTGSNGYVAKKCDDTTAEPASTDDAEPSNDGGSSSNADSGSGDNSGSSDNSGDGPSSNDGSSDTASPSNSKCRVRYTTTADDSQVAPTDTDVNTPTDTYVNTPTDTGNNTPTDTDANTPTDTDNTTDAEADSTSSPAAEESSSSNGDDNNDGGSGSKIPGPVKDDYPYPDECGEVDPWLYYKCECTSFVAWRINSRLGVKFANHYKGPNWGNANTWDGAARETKVPINKKPVPGCIAQTDAGSKGHVAWVTKVSSTTVTIEEYNYVNAHKYSTRTVPRSTFKYIHIKV
ncbi:hypothetical protein EV178_004474 [Coemansia sp. RSA 1646]|nr:hypothetical protein EV178_004474 [Coemansia sp. RSA 1646]